MTPANGSEATRAERLSIAGVNDVQALPPIMTMDQVGTFLRLSRQKTYELAHRQGFPAVRFGRAIRVPRCIAALARSGGKWEVERASCENDQ